MSRVNEARQYWERMDTFQANAGNFKNEDEPPGNILGSAYEELLYALRVDLREDIKKFHDDIIDTFTSVKAEWKGLRHKDLNDAVAEIKAELTTVAKVAHKAPKSELSDLRYILKGIHDIKAELDNKMMPPADLDVLRSEICKLDRKHLPNSMEGKEESMCCMLSTQICMLSTQLQNLRQDILSQLETPSRSIDSPGPTTVVVNTNAAATQGMAAGPRNCDVEAQSFSDTLTHTKVMDVLDVVARHQIELLGAVKRIDVKPQVDVSPIMDAIANVDFKPQVDIDLGIVLDAVEKVSVRLTALEIFLHGAKWNP